MDFSAVLTMTGDLFDKFGTLLIIPIAIMAFGLVVRIIASIFKS